MEESVWSRLLRRTRMGWFPRSIFVSEESAREILDAGAELANQGMTMRLILERRDEAGSRLGGYPVDEPVDRRVIYAAFISSLENGVHNGAMIVRNDRIVRVGVPCPERPSHVHAYDSLEKEKRWKTLTEESDTIVLLSVPLGRRPRLHDFALCSGARLSWLDAEEVRNVLLGSRLRL